MADKQLIVQHNPTIDSPPTDPFEALVSAYYQFQGYLTSSAKWFWVRDPDKSQRGYQDIDVFAVNHQTTVIVSVSANLDDKVRFKKGGDLNFELIRRQVDYFNRVELYLRNVEQYQWLVTNREVKHVIAFAVGNSLADRLLQNEEWVNYKIDLLYVNEIVTYLQNMIADEEIRIKTNNQIIRFLQMMSWIERDNRA